MDHKVDRELKTVSRPEGNKPEVTPSKAAIAGHPIHPMLIPFPIAFLVATFVCDLIFWRTGNSAWSTAS